jgi:hypothetical protein
LAETDREVDTVAMRATTNAAIRTMVTPETELRVVSWHGYLPDGFGGVHPLGTAPALANYPYFPGQDVARIRTSY